MMKNSIRANDKFLADATRFTSKASHSSIALDSKKNPYVVYENDGNDNNIIVMKYNGANWETVGDLGFSEDISNGLFIVLDNKDIPYIVYRDRVNNERVIVRKFNAIKNQWERVSS